MTQTIAKHLGEGFGKGELYAALAYDTSDAFGGMKIKGISIAPVAGKPAFNVGDTTTAWTALYTDKAISIYSTCASTNASTSFEPVYISTILTGAGQVGGRVRVNMATEVTLGSWANAFKASVDLGTSGGTTGLLSAICAELTMATTNISGTYAAIELEMTYGATSGALPKPCFIYAQSNGTARTVFDDYGDFVLFGTGFTAAAGHMLGVGTSTIRIGTGALGATKRYIPLSTTDGNYTTTKSLLVAADRVIDITTTCALTTGSIKSVEIAQTHTGANTASNIEVMKVQLTSDVKTGAWVNAIFGRVNYTVNGWAYGSASAVCGEVSLAPGGSHSGQGTYAVFQAELDVPASAVGIGAECSFFRASVWGNQSGLFDDSGFVFVLTGIASGSAHLWYDKGSAITPGDASEWLRVKTPGGTRYLMLYDSPS